METVQSAVSVALRKELLHLWANADPNSLTVGLVDHIVALLAPALVERLVAVASQRLPALLRGVRPSSPLPEVPMRATHGGGTCTEHEELEEELRGFLGSHDLLAEQAEARANLKKNVAAKLAMLHPWQRWLCGGSALLLPAGTVLSFCAVVAPALLAAAAFQGPSDSQGEEPTVGEENNGETMQEQQQLGVPHATLLRCRRRIFALERELAAREKAERERRAAEKVERDQVNQRLMDVNKQLEEKLKTRTEDLKRASQKLGEAQLGAEEAKTQLTERRKEVTQLRYQLEGNLNLRRNSEIREKEHNRALLRSAAREVCARQRAQERAEKLEKCLRGEPLAELIREPSPDWDSEKVRVDHIQAQLESKLVKRKNDRMQRHNFDSSG